MVLDGGVLYRGVKTPLDAFTDAGEESEFVFDMTSGDEMIWCMLREVVAATCMESDWFRLVCHLGLLLFEGLRGAEVIRA